MLLGKYDQRVQFTRPSVTGQNSFGEDTSTPASLGTFWARVRFYAGRELSAVQQRWAEAVCEITIQRQPGVDLNPSDTAVWNEKTYDILDITGPGTRDPEWLIVAKDHVE